MKDIPKAKFIAFIMAIVGLAFAFRFTPLAKYFTQENILAFLQSVRREWWGPIAFILIYAIGCVVALPGSVLTLTGGAVFGTFLGTIFNVIASNFGSTLAFFTARSLGRDFIKGLLKGGKLAQFDEQVQKSGFKAIFRLRLIPVVPFNGLNFGAGLSSVRYGDYFWGSFLGMLPGTFIYTYFADALLKGAQGANQKAILNMVIASALLIGISFLPSFYKKGRGA